MANTTYNIIGMIVIALCGTNNSNTVQLVVTDLLMLYLHWIESWQRVDCAFGMTHLAFCFLFKESNVVHS